MATWSSSTAGTKASLPGEPLIFTNQQLAAVLSAFPARPVTPAMDLATIQYNAGTQAVVEWLRKQVPDAKYRQVR